MRRGDDLMSLIISIGITAVLVTTVSMVVSSSFIFSADIARNAEEAQDVRNVFGILNRYSVASSSIGATVDGSGNSVVTFNDQTQIDLTSSGCTTYGSGMKRIEYIYNVTLPVQKSV